MIQIDVMNAPIGHFVWPRRKLADEHRAMFHIFERNDAIRMTQVLFRALEGFPVGLPGVKIAPLETLKGVRTNGSHIGGTHFFGKCPGNCLPARKPAWSQCIEILFRETAAVVITGTEKEN